MPLSWNEIRSRAITFSKEWEDESSESAEGKTFWDQFFGVFGVPRRRLATFETHVQKAGEKAGFIDLFWPGVLIAEHKSRGKNLKRAFTQAIDYFPGLKDADLPRYVVVSDFARFRIHDLETGDETEFPLADLHQHVQTFGFIAGYEARKFKEQDPVNIKAAERLAALHDGLKDIGYDGHDLEVYLVRLLFCMFAEDTGIFLPRGCFQDFIEQRTSADGSDLAARLSELFDVLNTPTERRLKNRDEQIAQFPFVNGKLFEERLRTAAFDARLRRILLECCELDWGQVSPAIFGSLFQAIMDKDARRSLGAHYTSEQNIMKVIGPLFLDDLRAEFERLKQDRSTQRVARLTKLHDRIAQLNFLDPACGCGNFLVIAYRELRQLELEILRELYRKPGGVQLELDAIGAHVKIDVDQFHGIEIEEWPAQIAQVAMWLMDHQMNIAVSKEFGDAFVRIPLTKSANIVQGNALQLDWNDVINAGRCSYVLGNPPFIGHHLQSRDQKEAMLACYNDRAPAGVMDFVSAWYCRAADYIENTKIRVAFVSTNSIAQGEQVGILWRELLSRGPLYIHFAHRTFKWGNEAKGVAAVYCVIIGFAKFPPAQALIYEYDTPTSEAHQIVVSQINAYLVDAPMVLLPNRNKNPFGQPELQYGSKPTDNGHFFLTSEERDKFINSNPRSARYIKRFMAAKEFLNSDDRWVLWLVNADPSELRRLPAIMERVNLVAAFRAASKAASTRAYPYPTLFRQVTQPKSDYILIPGHTSEKRSYIPFGFFDKDTIVGNSCFALPRVTKFHFGVLQSAMHMAWIRAVCGRLESRYRYSKDIVYNNFPWPDASDAQKARIESAAQAILDARAANPDATLADLYDPLAMPDNLRKAHQENDRAVDVAYGRRKFATEAERVGFLFEMYEQLTAGGAE